MSTTVATTPSTAETANTTQASTAPTPTTTSATPSSTTAATPSTTVSATQPYASASLYVGDLNGDVTEALLFEIFNAVGPVASVRVCRDAATRRSLGYAYVNFHRLEDAERALDTLNFKLIRNRACRIMWSHRDPALRRSGLGNIFVNHLAKDIDNKQLYDTFSMFGNILSCKVANNSKRESLGYGFVHYETDESANNAIAKVDGKVINGEKVSVQRFQSKKERPSAQAKNKYTNVFVKNLPMDITESKLQDMFKEFGTITSSSINIPTDRTDEKARAFGFLNFETPEQATAAVEGGNQIEILGKKLFVGRAQKKEERQKELAERFENLKMERQKKYAGVNLFVKNLSDDIDDAKLTEEFNKFGQITSCTVMKDNQTNKSRGFGFVCYTLPEEATRAVTEMNGKMFDGKPLYVALAQRKDQRRAQLEAQYAARQKLGGQMNPMQMGMPMQGQMGMNPMYGQPGMPLMFPQQHLMQQRGFGMNNAYPQQLLGVGGAGQRWNPQQQQMMGMGGVQQMRPGMGGVQQQMNYQLMPANQQMNAQQRQGGPNVMNGQNRGGPRPNNTGAPRGVNPLQQQQQMPGVRQQQIPQQGQQVRYNDNVRNQGVMQPGVSQQQVAPRSQPSVGESLTAAALASAPEEMRKQMIGERLFPLVRGSEPNLAGKITGMLLEMDNGELLHLLESREALNEKIQEALTVLQQNPPEDETQQ